MKFLVSTTRFMTDELFVTHSQSMYLLSVCDRRY